MVIPNGWLSGTWESVLDGFVSGATPYRGTPSYYKGGIPWVSSGELNYNTISDTLEHITDKAIRDTNLLLHESGTFLMAITGLEAAGTRGSCALLGIKATTNQSCMAIYSTSRMSVEYLFHYYCLYAGKLAFEYCQGTKQQSYTAKIVKKLPIIYPEALTEQRAIVAALSDVDGYIAALEKLIAKKRNIKKGAMQELLTGKRRLPGFSKEWAEKAIGTFATVVSGGTPSTFHSQYWGGSIPWMSSGELNLKRVHYVEGRITSAGLENSSTTMLPPYSVLIGLAGQGKTRGTVAMNYFELCTNQSIAAIFPSPHVYSSEYLYQNLDSRYDELRELSTGDGGRGGLNLTIIRNLTIPFPELTEQTAIAEILSDMDAEIDALMAKLIKVRNIKQGMMQELLTGRIRLLGQETMTAPAAKVVKLPKKAETTKKAHHGYSEGFEDAVILVALVNAFGTQQYPFTAFDCQKFPYLFHRHLEGTAKGFGKFAAGPYNPAYKYKTAQPIALDKKYIREHAGNYKGFVVDVNAQEALAYFAQWFGDEPIKWLEQFRYIPKRKDELELLTTTDKAMVELLDKGKTVTLQAVKELIKKSPAWKYKLRRAIFSDENITRAIRWSNELFGTEAQLQ